MLAGPAVGPVVLGFAVEQVGSDLANVGCARAYPVVTVAKTL